MSDPLRKMFAELDTDGSGSIEASELLAQMPSADLVRAKKILAMMDVDGDGHVSYAEFLAFYAEPESITAPEPVDEEPEELTFGEG